VSASDSLCGQGWHQYKNEKCFRVIRGSNNWNLTWIAANDICQTEYGGQLASIHSEEENSFIFSLMFTEYDISSNVWIGGKRLSGTLFEWMDRSSFDFTKWGQQTVQPSGDGDCVEMWSPFLSDKLGCPQDLGKLDNLSIALTLLNQKKFDRPLE